MRLRPLNDTVIIEPDVEMIAVDTDQTVLNAIKSNLIVLPDKNTVMKVSNKATVIDAGPSCKEKLKNERVVYSQLKDIPSWNGNKIIKEHYIRGVFMKTGIRPLRDNVLVEIEQVKEKTAGGIYLPDQAKEDKTEGNIVAIGEVKSVKVGDRVLFGKYAGDEILLNNKKYKILKESELLAAYDSKS